MSEVLVRLEQEAESAGNMSEAGHWWDPLELHEPYSSRATEGVMRVLVQGGDHALALRRYQLHDARLREHLEVAPERRLRDLADRIRRGLGQAGMLATGLCHLAYEMSSEIPRILLDCWVLSRPCRRSASSLRSSTDADAGPSGRARQIPPSRFA